jgi:poly(3-hydroxybutyrate) depolymerase
MIATCVPALSRSTLGSTVETLKVATKASAGYWTGAVRRGATPLDLATEGLKWWTAMTDRSKPTWSTAHEVVFESPTSRLRDFSQGTTDDVVPTLVLPPQAGHDSCIVDFSPVQSQMQVIRAAGLTRLFSMDWVGATPASKDATVDDYLADIDRAVSHMAPDGGPVNLVGDCQGGWLATIYAALHPERTNTLTIAGAPIDFHGDAEIARYVELLGAGRRDLSFYKGLVASGGGIMDGAYLLGGFIVMRPENEISRQLDLLNHLDDAEHLARYAEFEDWFKHTQGVPGAFYLWIVEHLFRDNALIRGELEIGGETVDLRRIECPLFMLAGEKDHITPPEQVWAASEFVSTSEARTQRRLTSGGHLGLFMGREALRDHWPELMAGVHSASVAKPKPAAAKRASKAAAPTRPPAIKPGY